MKTRQFESPCCTKSNSDYDISNMHFSPSSPPFPPALHSENTALIFGFNEMSKNLAFSCLSVLCSIHWPLKMAELKYFIQYVLFIYNVALPSFNKILVACASINKNINSLCIIYTGNYKWKNWELIITVTIGTRAAICVWDFGLRHWKKPLIKSLLKTHNENGKLHFWVNYLFILSLCPGKK